MQFSSHFTILLVMRGTSIGQMEASTSPPQATPWAFDSLINRKIVNFKLGEEMRGDAINISRARDKEKF